MPSPLEIHTAVPLLAAAGERPSRILDDHDHDHDDDHDDPKTVLLPGCGSGAGSPRRWWCVLAAGFSTGFVIQIVSLGAYACLLLNNNNGGGGGESSSSASPQQHFDDDDGVVVLPLPVVAAAEAGWLLGRDNDPVVSAVLSVLTQIDLAVYVLIWIAFTGTMTESGMSCILRSFAAAGRRRSSSSSSPSQQRAESGSGGSSLRRLVFVGGVRFLVGIVLGAFAAWTAVDTILGFPIPLGPILATVALDLSLCYLMVRCFDLGGNDDDCDYDDDDSDDSDESDDDDAAGCC